MFPVDPRSRRSPRPWRLFGCMVTLLMTGFGVAMAGDMVRTDPAATVEKAPPAELDGLTFNGEFGILGQGTRGNDTWIFKKGSFTSKSCVECGFPQNIYATHAENGVVKFLTRTNCPVSDAQIVWEGTVSDGRIEGIYTWTLRRWYRTVEKQFWFKGALEDGATAATKSTIAGAEEHTVADM